MGWLYFLCAQIFNLVLLVQKYNCYIPVTRVQELWNIAKPESKKLAILCRVILKVHADIFIVWWICTSIGVARNTIPVVLCAGAMPGAWHFWLTLNSCRIIQCQFPIARTTKSVCCLSFALCNVECATHSLMVDRSWEIMPFYLFLPFSVVSSLPVEIFIDPPPGLTPPPSPLVCPSGQWFCPNDHTDQHIEGHNEKLGEGEKGACISEHTSCNGRCPSPAIWWVNSAVCRTWQCTGVTSQVNVYQKAPSAGSYLVVDIFHQT